MKDRVFTVLEMYNEGTVMVVTLLMIGFTEYGGEIDRGAERDGR